MGDNVKQRAALAEQGHRPHRLICAVLEGSRTDAWMRTASAMILLFFLQPRSSWP